VAAALAAGFALGLAKFPALPRWSGQALAGAVVVLLGFLSHQQSRLYQDDEMLFRANIAANPRSWMGHHILAQVASRSPERREEAIALYRTALQLKTDNPDSH